MKRSIASCLLATSVFATAPVLAAPQFYAANLSGAAEEPPTGSAGTGVAQFTIDPATLMMRVEVDFSGLTGTVTAAHIHCCTAAPGAGNVGVASQVPSMPLFPLGVQAGSFDQTFDMGFASSYNAGFITAQGSVGNAFSALLAGFDGGTAYFNIHSTVFGAGEIRGFAQPALLAVPEPGSVALLLTGLGLLGIGSRWRSRA